MATPPKDRTANNAAAALMPSVLIHDLMPRRMARPILLVAPNATEPPLGRKRALAQPLPGAGRQRRFRGAGEKPVEVISGLVGAAQPHGSIGKPVQELTASVLAQTHE